MKVSLLLVALIFLFIPLSFGQAKDFYVGPVISVHNEMRSRSIYGPGYVEKNSKTQFLGFGIRAQKKFLNSWAINTGVSYVERYYEMSVPFNHCFFLKPSEGCTAILAHTDKFGYKTLEIPFGINKYLFTKKKWDLYLNINALIAFDFQSFYNSKFTNRESSTQNEINVFSKSLTSSIGYSYLLTNRFKITLEPFLRLIHTQRADPILLTGYEESKTNFDNFGANFILFYQLNYRD